MSQGFTFRQKAALLAAVVVLGLCAPAVADVQVTGNLKSILGSSSAARKGMVRFTLQNYGGNVPRTSSGPIGQVSLDVSASATDGSVSTTLSGNTEIQPDNTYYRIEFWSNGVMHSATSCYINPPSFDLNKLANCSVQTTTPAAFTVYPVVDPATVSADSMSGTDYATKIASAFLASSTVQVNTANNPIASASVVIPKSGTLLVRGNGTFTVAGIRFTDSTTDTSGTGVLECPEGATIKLADGANVDVVSQVNFSSLTGSLNVNGLWRARVKGCVIDGNRAHNTSGRGLALYGWALNVTDNIVQNCAGDGIYTEWGVDRGDFSIGVDAEMSAYFARNTSMNNGGNGHTHYGPHDSMFVGNVYKQNGGWGWTDGAQDARIPGAKGNGAGSHIWNTNSYNNLTGGFRTTQGVVANDLAVSGTGTAVLLDSMAGASLLSGITASGLNANGVGLECKNGSVNHVTGRIANSSVDGLKINGCANSSFDLVIENNANGINFAQDNGGNTIAAKVSTQSGQAVFHGTPVLSTSTFMRVRADGTVIGNYLHVPDGATGTRWALTDAPQHWTGGMQDFDAGLRAGNVDGGIGSITMMQGDSSSAGYLLWRRPNGNNIAQLTGTAGPNLVLDLFGGADFYVNGGTVRVGDFVSSGTIWNTGGDVVTSTAGKGLVAKSPDGTKCACIGIDDTGAMAATTIACP
jgi:hypothetical protein